MAKWIFLLVFSGANLHAQSVQQLEANLAKKPDSLSTRMQLANLHFKESNWDKVIELLNPYTDQLDNNGFVMLAMSYSNKKDYANEVRVLNTVLTRDEDNYRWHMLLGQAYLKQSSETTSEEAKQNQLTFAIQRLRQALKLSPKYKPAFDLLLTTLLQQKAHNEARELLMEGIDKFGARPDLLKELCRLDSTDGFLPQAVNHCRESIRISPTYPDHYVYLVQTLWDQKEDVQAERNIVSAARRFPKSEFVQWAAGTIFMKRKNYPVAARYFQAAVAADEKSGRAQFGLAQALFESGSEEQALPHFTAACKADRTTVDTFLAAAGRLKQKGNSSLGQKFSQAANTCR